MLGSPGHISERFKDDDDARTPEKLDSGKADKSSNFDNFSAGLNILGGLGGFERGAPIAKDYEDFSPNSKRKVSII